MRYIKVGEIVNTFGLKGELKVLSLTDFVSERFKKEATLYILKNKEYIKVTVFNYRVHKGFVLVSFKDLLDINLVEQYKGCVIYVSSDDIKPLENGKYYFFQLTNLDVYCDNKFIGIVSSVESGYQTILRIKTQDREILVPYVDAFIKNVDLDNNRIDVNLIEGF